MNISENSHRSRNCLRKATGPKALCEENPVKELAPTISCPSGPKVDREVRMALGSLFGDKIRKRDLLITS